MFVKIKHFISGYTEETTSQTKYPDSLYFYITISAQLTLILRKGGVYKNRVKNMIYHTDGFTFGSNPSSLGGGYTICDGFGNFIETQKVFKDKFTSNEAELLGVFHALVNAVNGDEIVTDSRNTLAWIRSGNPKARPDLKTIAGTAKRIQKEKGITLTWKPREENWAGIYNEENYGA